MQVLYLIILCINETNLDENKTEVNHRQQTTLQLAYRDLSSSRRHELMNEVFYYSQRRNRDQFIAGLSQGF